MKNAIRQVAAEALTLPGVPRVLKRWNRDRAVVFMLHRFADPDRDRPGHPTRTLRSVLEFLRRHDFHILHVDELIRRARTRGSASRGAGVAFILDDGYHDQVEQAAPIFAEFDAPAAIFPATGFVDRELWLWWDHLEYVLQHAAVPRVELHAGTEAPLTLQLEKDGSRSREVRRATLALKRMSADDRDEALRTLAERCQVKVPLQAPPGCRPMSWDDARRCEAMGIRVGPHSVTHPILSRETDERARWEIETSWARIRDEVSNPVPVFCYPNGASGDFGLREMKILEELDILAGVTARPGYLGLAPGLNGEGPEPLSAFEVPRYSFTDAFPTFVRIISGLAPGGVHRIAAPH